MFTKTMFAKTVLITGLLMGVSAANALTMTLYAALSGKPLSNLNANIQLGNFQTGVVVPYTIHSDSSGHFTIPDQYQGDNITCIPYTCTKTLAQDGGALGLYD